MKCKYCNAEVAPNTRFCTTCGADLSKLDKCVNCGELIDREAMTCPHCGTGQPREEKVEVERNCSKKWLLLLPLIALVVGAGTWYFFSDGFSFGDSTQTTTAETVNSAPIKTDNPAVEEAKTRLKDILSAIITNDVYGENLSQNMNKYFTEGYKTFYNRACEKADKEGCEQPKIWWQYSDDDPSSFVINSVESLSEDEVKSILTLSGELNVGTYEVILKREKDDWLIDKVIEKETHMKDDEEAKSEDEGYNPILSERKLSNDDLKGKTKKELELMRNSIYARYGYRFKRDDLFSHFSQFEWYAPTTSDMSIVYSSMSEIEKYNVDFIKKHE